MAPHMCRYEKSCYLLISWRCSENISKSLSSFRCGVDGRIVGGEHGGVNINAPKGRAGFEDMTPYMEGSLYI